MDYKQRESQWLVLRRCLAIIRRVQAGPARWPELVAAVQAVDPQAYGTATGRALKRRLENDLHRIREALDIELGFDRQAGGYTIREAWTPLLNLPDADLTTLSWLAETFDLDSPQHDEIQGLIDRLRLYLGPERRADLVCRHYALQVSLVQRDQDELAPGVWEKLLKARQERRLVEFDYLSPLYEDHQPRRHVVEPYEISFDTARGHYYLRGWCRAILDDPQRPEQGQYIFYRVGRITNMQVRPEKLPASPPRARRYAVQYQLMPLVARQGVTQQPGILEFQVTLQPDGSAVVTGVTENLFFTVQTLLHYEANCQVLGGPELLAEMQRVVRELAALYA